jgi:hypothetical protein
MQDLAEISKSQLAQIRGLSDQALIRLITEISMYGWVKAQETLKGLVETRGADRRI